MPDSLLQTALGKLGLTLPPDPTPVDPLKQAMLDSAAQQQQAKWSKLHQMVAQAPEALTGFLKGLVQQDPTVDRSQFDQPGYAPGALLGAASPFALKGIPGMYSRVERLAESLPESINAGKLNNILKSGRVSQEETDWRKLPQFIEKYLPNRQVAKSDLVQHLQQNPLDVSVTTHRDPPVNDFSAPDAQYGSYTMPGAVPGTYKEDLIQLPVKSDPTTGANLDPIFTGQHWDEPNVLVHVRHNERNLPETWKTVGGGATPVPGPLGRMLENVQSDWHQRGAHGGYTGSGSNQGNLEDAMFGARDALSNVNQEALAEIGKMAPELRINPSDEWDTEELAHNLSAHMQYYIKEGHPELQPAYDKLTQARVTYDNAADAARRESGNAVPDAPFKDNWSELALKQQLLDIAHNHPDLKWLGIAPSSELRARGEVISPEFQDKQLPRTLEKLLKPFGGSVEPNVDLGIAPPKTGPNSLAMLHDTVIRQDPTWDDTAYTSLAQVWPRDNKDNARSLFDLIQKQQPKVTAPIARLTPEMLQQIREKGFPLLLAMLAAHGLSQPEASHGQVASGN